MTVRIILAMTVAVGVTKDIICGQPPGSNEPDRAEAPMICELEFRISPLMDLMMYLRELAEQDEDAVIPDIDGMAEAVPAIRALFEDVGGRWGVFSGPAHSCETAADLVELANTFPETITLRSGKEMELRRITQVMADALAKVEPAYLRELWPGRREKLQKAVGALKSALGPKEREIYAFMQVKLGAEEPQKVLPVYLVVEAPWPGAMTYRSRAGAMSFVGLNAAEGSQLLEIIIHETLHTLETTTAREGNVFTELRAALAEAGVERGDPRMHDVPHMVMFVQAAETVRRHLDPAHIDYGETEANDQRPLYERDAASVAAVREPWRAYLDGSIDRAEAVRRIVATAGTERAETEDE